MLLGLDIGGTNTDLAVVGETIETFKAPNGESPEKILGLTERPGRLCISTSQPLNLVLTGYGRGVEEILIPGPGLHYENTIPGYIDHRGDILEPLDNEAIENRLKNSGKESVSITAKFSVRNPAIELAAYNIALKYFPEDCIALSYKTGELNFPARAATTFLNAIILRSVHSIKKMISSIRPDFYFFKGDGGILPPHEVILNPSHLLNSSAAAVSLGAFYLTRKENALVIDIGGTTTDFIPLKEGKPLFERLAFQGRKTLNNGILTSSLPYGGDSVVSDKLEPRREGNSLAFGGKLPTLTDALNCCGFTFGDFEKSYSIKNIIAQNALEQYTGYVKERVRLYSPSFLIGTGYLARFLIPAIAKEVNCPYLVPDHAESANAVGVAVSRMSLVVHIHADTGKGRILFNGTPGKLNGLYRKEDIIEYSVRKVSEKAISLGASLSEVNQIEVTDLREFDVIKSGRREGSIIDLVVRLPPGISEEAI